MKDNELFEKFWSEDIYQSNINNIYNEKITNIIELINKLEKKINSNLNSNTLFRITDNYGIEVINTKEIIKEVNKIKKDNIFYLKTHVECIPEYFKLVYKILTSTSLNNITINNFNNILEKENPLNLNNIIEDKLDLVDVNNLFNDFEKNLLLDDINYSKQILTKLKYNWENIEFIIKEIVSNKKNIILFDGENILKSFKIQFLLSTQLDKAEFDKYFDKWFYGDFSQLNNINSSMSLSEYSGSIKYTEPFNSVGLNIDDKRYLIDLIISNYFKDYFVIYPLNNRITDMNKPIDENYFLNSNSLCIPILYSKFDIREQDDHLLIFLYEYLSIVMSDIKIVTADKYKFYNKNINLSNINLLYNLDESNINLIISEKFKHNFIKINNNVFSLPNYFPLVETKDFIKDTKENLNVQELNNLKKMLLLKYLDYLIIINNINNNINESVIISIPEEFIKIILIFLSQTIKFVNTINSKFKIIYEFLEENSKKEIFKKIFENNNTIFTDNFIDQFVPHVILKFKIILQLYLIFKSFVYLYINNEYITKLSKLFSLIITNYDEIENNIHKIRKLSNKNTLFNMIFLELNSLYLFIKKNGFCKKN